MAITLPQTGDIEDVWEELRFQTIPNMPVSLFKMYVEKTWITQKLVVIAVHRLPRHANNSIENYNWWWIDPILENIPIFGFWLNIKVNYIVLTTQFCFSSMLERLKSGDASPGIFHFLDADSISDMSFCD